MPYLVRLGNTYLIIKIFFSGSRNVLLCLGVQLYIVGPTIFGTRIVRDPPKINIKNLGPGSWDPGPRTQSIYFARPCGSQKEHQYNQGPGTWDPGSRKA